MVKKLVKLISFVILFSLTSNYLFASGKYFPAYVDRDKFSGKWFEIARTYNNFQKDCKDSYVEYVLNEEKYDIKNSCTSVVDNSDISYNGTGKSANEKVSNFSKIKMTYFYIFSKEYQIVYNDNYNFAVVSDDDFESVWIMSRTKSINEDKLNEILSFLKKYLDLDKLIYENRG